MQVACLRGGELPVEQQKAWHQQWARSYGIKNPYEQEAKEAKTAEEVKVKKEKTSRRPARSARSTRSRSKKADVQAQPSVNMLVPHGENLPAVGDLMPGACSGWQDGKVARMTNNFAHVDGHLPTAKQAQEGRLALLVGMVVSMLVAQRRPRKVST